MLKKIMALLLSAAMLSALPVVSSAEEEATKTNILYCLSNNGWNLKEGSKDVETYQNLGIELVPLETGATYSWNSGSDGDVIKNEKFNESTGRGKLQTGSINSVSGDTDIWSTWNRKATATATFDLKDVYWVSQVDVWSSSARNAGQAENFAQTGVVNVKIGETLENMRSLPAAQAAVPTDKEMELAGTYWPSYASVSLSATKARYVEVTYSTQEGMRVPQFIAKEVAIFGYLEKPVDDSADEIIEEVVADATLIHENANPEINKHDTYLVDLGGMYEITKTTVQQYNSAVSGLSGYEVWLSSDGKNYSYIGLGEESDTVEYELSNIDYDITQKMYARYVKLIMKQNAQRSGYLVKNIEIFGRPGVEQQRIDTEATYSYWTKTPYRTSDDIRLQDMEHTVLMDGDTETVITTNEEWASVVVDLQTAYQIGDVDIYSLANDHAFLEGAEIRYSLDGKKWFTYTYYLNHNEKTGGIVKSSFSGMPGRNARFLKIIMQSANHAISVSEIVVNGYPVKMARAKTPPQVPLRVEMKNYLLAYLDWSTYNNDNSSRFAVYVEKNPFTNTKELTPVATYERFDEAFLYNYTTKTRLEPETTYYFAITPFDDEGNERKDVKPVKITTQGVLGTKVRDVFNITNHPSYNGGSTKKFGSYDMTSRQEAVRLYDEMGASNKTRQWDLGSIEMYTNIGVSTFMINNNTGSVPYGNYMFSNGNEADLTKADVNTFLVNMKSYYKQLKNLDRRYILADPVLGGTEIGSLNWFDSLYQAGNGVETKNAFDVVDVHLYCKSVDEQVPGLPQAAPEQLFKKIADVRGVMARYDDGDKPIISTEYGYQTSDVAGYSVKNTYEQHRNYLVRSYLIAISQGIREMWWYNFHDDGLDLTNQEHAWGLIDYFAVPKPAYYGYYNMYQQLRNSKYVGFVPGLSSPYYGVELYDETKNKEISAIWAADNQKKTMQFETLSGQDETVEVIGTDGSFQVIKTVGGRGSVTIGGAPVFIYSDAGVKAVSISVAFAANTTFVGTTRGSDVTFTMTRKSLGMGQSGKVEVIGLPAGWTVANNTEFDATQSTVDVVIHVPETAQETTYNFEIRAAMDNGVIAPVSVEVKVNASLSVRFVPEPIEKGNWNDWRLAAHCTNVVNVPVSGKLSVLGSESITFTTMEALEINDLQPGQTQTVYFNMSAPKNSTAVGSFMLDVNGAKTQIDRKLDFSACVNDGIVPTLDGVLSPGEWDAAQMEEALSPSIPADNCSFKLYKKWDNDNLYIAVDVTDDFHSQPYTGVDMWQGDGIQIAIDPARVEGVGCPTIDYFELGVAATEEMELQTWVWYADLVIKKDRIFPAEGAVKRTENNHTIYEFSIPWTFLNETGIVNHGDIFGFSIAVNDSDGSRRSYVEYRKGIASGKNTNAFQDLVLIKQ
ncbi:MAG: hypothetical protein E7397_07395 [Ruminococcaceae bacterium]|nr:hypothetical protein [Oscillospiraceae bacterium]